MYFIVEVVVWCWLYFKFLIMCFSCLLLRNTVIQQEYIFVILSEIWQLET